MAIARACSVTKTGTAGKVLSPRLVLSLRDLVNALVGFDEVAIQDD
jgi:hypothetical protein